MLNSSNLDPSPTPTEATAESDASHSAAYAFFEARIAAMPAVEPAMAVNGDRMAGVAEFVERELRVVGFLS